MLLRYISRWRLERGGLLPVIPGYHPRLGGCSTNKFLPWQMSLETGSKVDTDLSGSLCASAPKQRTYRVIDDGEYLW